MAEVKGDLAAMKGDLAAVKGDLVAVQNNLTSLWSELGRVGNQVENTNGKVTASKRLIKAQASTLDGVQNTVSGVQSTVNGVENTVNGVENRLDGMESELVGQKRDMSANFNHTFALFNRLSSGQEVLYQNLSTEVKTDDLRIQEQLNNLQQVMDIKVLDQGEAIASCCNQTLVQIDHLADRQETLYRNISADMSLLCLPPSNDPPTTIEPLTIASTATATEPPTDQGYTCGGTSGWRRAVFLNMTDPTHNCPSGWEETGYTKRTCGRASESYGGTYDSATFPTGGLEYSRVCGRAVAYQFGYLSAFYRSPSQNIESHYVDGLSLTHGRPGSRQHIWTFAGGIAEAGTNHPLHRCPCDGGTSPVPGFLGNDYFCESGIHGPWVGHYIFHPDDQLWDGRDCLATSSCCSLNNPPYFIKEIGVNTNDDIEGRICSTYARSQDSNTAIELLEIYVQ